MSTKFVDKYKRTYNANAQLIVFTVKHLTMRNLYIILSLLISTAVFSQNGQSQKPVELKGTIVNADGKPLSNIYLYTTEGTEEAMTDAQGSFKITTWKKLPVTITVQDVNYHRQQVRVNSADERPIITLKRK